MTYSIIEKIFNYIYYKFTLKKICESFASCGNNVHIGSNPQIAGANNIHIKNNVSIGNNAVLLTTRANIYIGNYVMFGPEVAIVTGNHRINYIGEYMMCVGDDLKEERNDMDVVINDDVWVGLRAIILKGVTIGKGSVIAAGAIVNCDVPDYTIYYSKDKMKRRFSDEEVIQHEKAILIKYKTNNYS